MGNRIAIERRPVPLALVLKGDATNWQQKRDGEDLANGRGGETSGRRGGPRSYNSSLHVWRFFADDDGDDPQLVRNEPVCLNESFAFDKHQVYLALHIYSENAAAQVKITNGDDDRGSSPGDANVSDGSESTTRTTVESLLASSVEAFTPRGLASCLEEAFITSTSSSVADDESTAADTGEGAGEVVTGNTSTTTVEEDGDDCGQGGCTLAYSMYVWRGKDSPRYPQALALTKSFELEKALKRDGKRALRLLFRGAGKVPLSSVYSTQIHNNHLLSRASDATESMPEGVADDRRRGHADEEDEDEEDSEDGHGDGGSDEDEERPYSRQNHLYHQLLKRRRLTRRSAAAGGEAGESPRRTDGGSNGSVPKLSLPRIKNLFHHHQSPSSKPLQGRSLSADSLDAIISSTAAATHDNNDDDDYHLDSPQPTSVVAAGSGDASSSPMTDDSSPPSSVAIVAVSSSTIASASSSSSPRSSASSSSSSSSPFESTGGKGAKAGVTRSKSSSSAASATIPAPSTPPPSPKKLKGRFQLPPIKTERMSKSGPVQTIPMISGFNLSDLQALQEKEEQEGDIFNRAEVSLRSEKLKKYDSICSKITDELYLGSQTVSRDVEMLKEKGVTHILNCAGSICPEYHPDQFTYRTLYLMDGVREDITCMLYDIIEWMENVISSNGKILVHCQQGVSRSSAMMIGYLMWKRGWDFERTHMFVKERRGVSSPNAGFICQLLYLAKRLSLARGGTDQETRLYQVVTHTMNDPDFVVAKLAKKETLAELQDPSAHSPSCYILQSPSEFFIWIGSQCSERFVEVAKRTVLRVKHFENATGPVHTVEQGKETDDFRRCLKQVNLEEVA